ncbi:MAG: Holliday junction branch migration protein RuvA [Pseudomonadota bacterium]
MIGMLRGTVALKAEGHVILDAGGVGYVVYCAERTLAELPVAGGQAALFTELLVREDLLQLFGFTTREERDFYRMITAVQGVGARLGLAITGHLRPENAARALALGDSASIRAVPGVGPKLAARIVAELKDKAPALMAIGSGQTRPAMGSAPEPLPEPAPAAAPSARMAGPAPFPEALNPTPTADALSALTNLGYPAGDAAAALAEAAHATPDADTAALIRAALRQLAPKT